MYPVKKKIFSVLLVVFLLSFLSSNDCQTIEYFPDENHSFQVDYIQHYFNISYNVDRKRVITNVKTFFGRSPIIFICHNSNKHRKNNIRSIIEKYKLKNYYIVNAISHHLYHKKQNTCTIDLYNKQITLKDISDETSTDMVELLSHLKAMLLVQLLDCSTAVIVEDNVTFDMIPFSTKTLDVWMNEINDKNVSLYTDTTKKIASVAYTISKSQIQQFFEKYTLEKTKNIEIEKPERTTSYLKDEYLTKIFNFKKTPYNIILPTVLGNTKLDESDYDKVYRAIHIRIKIPTILYVMQKNNFYQYYKKSNIFQKIKLVYSFEQGVLQLYKTGGFFIFHNDTKINIMEKPVTSFIECSSAYIFSVPKHPYLQNILKYGYMNAVHNPHISFPLVSWDYQFYKTNVNEKFTFIIPSYNNEKWIEKNLKSILKQTYTNYNIIYIDDDSDDNTYKMVETYRNGLLKGKLQLFKNKKRMYQAYSRYKGYKDVNPDDILVLLDGDDWLYDEHVLQNIKNEYDAGHQCTYGRAIFFQNGQEQTNHFVKQYEYAKDVRKYNKYRENEFFNVHLRTCRAKFLQTIPKKFLKSRQGTWLENSTDMAEWFYIMEQTNGNTKFMDIVTYVYNRDNSEIHSNSWYHNKNTPERNDTIKYIRSMKK